ncbi:hypothetical protein EYF80_041727 [Liparis tanakae]|uniref:Uncharacterized protein n=1 Tax=Liparis tanakae TaxID=230148 RepID=A0A4Z2G4J1_9TELE|nr:hypothetical protein EYF80_041727 [Liparis tanakae]
MAADYSVARERYETKPGLRPGSSSAWGVVVPARESIPSHNRWHKKDKRQLRTDFHLTAWDKTLVPHAHPSLHSIHHRTQKAPSPRPPEEEEKGGGDGGRGTVGDDVTKKGDGWNSETKYSRKVVCKRQWRTQFRGEVERKASGWEEEGQGRLARHSAQTLAPFPQSTMHSSSLL